MQLVCVKWGKSVSQYFSIANGVRQGGILSPKLFALYMNRLSGALSLCKAGCYIDAQCMNHLMYADDICVMAPSAIALQKLLDVCYEYGITNDLIYNPLKSVCMVFKPRRFKLYCPTVAIGDECLKYVDSFKYLGFVFSENKKDDADMLRQLRSLYAKANRITRMFHYCTVDVKLLLIKSYCTSFYCGYLWSDYKASTFSKLRVAFNIVYRRVLGLPPYGKKISLIFQGGWGRLSASSCPPPPPRAPMVVFPLVEFAKALISLKILVHAHACDKTNK